MKSKEREPKQENKIHGKQRKKLNIRKKTKYSRNEKEEGAK